MFEVVPVEEFPGMFKVKWPDGVLSENMYNWERANEFRRRLELNPESLPTIGFEPVKG